MGRLLILSSAAGRPAGSSAAGAELLRGLVAALQPRHEVVLADPADMLWSPHAEGAALVLIDLGGAGWDVPPHRVVALLRRRLPGVPILLAESATGTAAPARVDRALAAGADAVLPARFEPAELDSLLRRWLDRAAAARSSGPVLVSCGDASPLPALLSAALAGATVARLEPGRPAPLAAGEEPRLLAVDAGAGTGFERAFVAAARKRFPACPIIALHPPRARAAAGRMLASGADVVLRTPVCLDAFARIVRNLVGESRSPAADESAAAAFDPFAAFDAATAAHAIPPAVATVAPEVAAPASNGARPQTGGAGDAGDVDALSVFVRGLAHEVNNPLTTIRGFLQLLASTRKPGLSKDEEREAYRTMEHEAQRIGEVVQELEYFTGLRRPRRTQVDAGALLRDALKQTGFGAVKASWNGDLTLLADRDQTAMALHHLFAYLKASAPPQGSADVTVGARRSGDHVEITVSGRSAGPADEAPERLLLPLYRSPGAAVPGQPEGAERPSLARVFGIARAHGGSLDVRREPPDRLRFRIELPVRP